MQTRGHGEPLAPGALPSDSGDAPERIESMQLINVDSQVDISKSLLRRFSTSLFGRVKVTNTSSENLPAPLYLVINTVIEPPIVPLNAEGLTDSGKPYYLLWPAQRGFLRPRRNVSAIVSLQLSDPNVDVNDIEMSVYYPRADARLYFFHNDHLGTPQRITDASQTVVWAADYQPFGSASLPVEMVTNNLRFPGQYFDAETGLHYNHFRDYDPTTGRYLQSDPIGLNGGLNSYLYVGGNPLRWVDRAGLVKPGGKFYIDITGHGTFKADGQEIPKDPHVDYTDPDKQKVRIRSEVDVGQLPKKERATAMRKLNEMLQRIGRQFGQNVRDACEMRVRMQGLRRR